MHSTVTRGFLSLLLAGLAFGVQPTPTRAEVPRNKESTRQINNWVRQLGDKSFQKREQAQRQLLQAGPAAMSAVLAATQSSDLEVRNRAQRIRKQIEDAITRKFLTLGATVQQQAGFVRLVRITNDNLPHVTHSDLKALLGFPKLKELHLRGASFTDTALAAIARHRHLKILHLGNTRISDQGLIHLRGLTTLEELEVEGSGLTGVGLAHLGSLSALRKLQVCRSKLTDAGLAVGMKGLKQLAKLETLSFGHERIGDASLRRLCQLRSLRGLDLTQTQITDVGLAHLPKLKRLEHLSVGGTVISDKGLEHLLGCKTLVFLNLNTTPRVTARGLTLLRKLPVLKRVFFCGQCRDLQGILELVARSVPPVWVTVEQINPKEGTLLYSRQYTSKKEETVGLKGKVHTRTRLITESVRVRVSLKETPMYDVKGKRLTTKELIQRITVGSTLALSADGKMINAKYREALHPRTVLVVPARIEFTYQVTVPVP